MIHSIYTKKIILILFLFSVMIFQNQTSANATGTKDIFMNLDFGVFNKDKIEDISLGFCNKGLDKTQKDLTMNINPGIKEKLCLVFVNKAKQNINIELNIFSQSKTKNGTIACDTSPNIIGQKIFHENFPMNITISGTGYTKKELSMGVPFNTNTGNYNLCLAYHIINNKTTSEILEGGIFKIQIRKTNKLDIVITRKNTIINILKKLSKNNTFLYAILVIALIIFISTFTKSHHKTKKRHSK